MRDSMKDKSFGAMTINRTNRRRSRRGAPLAGLAAACVLGLCSLAATAQAQRTVFIAGHTLMPDGSLQSGRAVVVERGRIVSIEDAEEFADDDASVQRFPNHVLSPGLIELGSSLGVRGNQAGGTEPIEPGLRAVDAIDVHDPFLRLALEHGITAAMVLPDASRIIGGRAATFRTHPGRGALGPMPDLLNANGPAFLSMGPQVLDFSYGPTSRAGAAFELREGLKQSRAEGSAVSELLPHDQGMIALCASIEDVDLILTATTEAFGGMDSNANRLVLIYTPDDPSLVEDLAQEEVPFVVGPLTFSTPSVQLLSVAGLANAGATVAFSNRTPLVHPDWLRTSAALSVKHGMDPAAARRGMTSVAAEVAGIQTGAIRAGADADLVLFTGDPLLLSSRVDAVFIRGERVHGVRPSVSEIGESEGAFEGGAR